MALIFGSLLLVWWAITGMTAWRQPAESPAMKPLFAVCENGRMALRTTPRAGKGTNEGDTGCQPFTSRLIAISRADAPALSAVPGIGMTTAQKIVADREYRGHFYSAADLTRVPGIGAARATHFAEYLSFE